MPDEREIDGGEYPALAEPEERDTEVPAIEDCADDDPVMALLAAGMPWVISLLFHVGLFLVLLFLVFIIYRKPEEEDVYFASAVHRDHAGGRVTPLTRKVIERTSSEARKRVNPKKTPVNLSEGRTAETLAITGLAGGGGSGPSANGLKTSGTGPPGNTFIGQGPAAFNYVYVIDRSGSMIDTFDALRREMKRSIFSLRESQNFHVIFFAADEPEEFGHGRLVPAGRLAKKKVAEYLQNVVPRGQTDPVPALERAFAVLQGARKQGLVIYLLTDGRFPDNQKVLDVIDRLNTGRTVQIFTYLYGNRPPEAVAVMKRIAAENNGGYRYVRESGY